MPVRSVQVAVLRHGERRGHLGVESTAFEFVRLDPFDEFGVGHADQLIEECGEDAAITHEHVFDHNHQEVDSRAVRPGDPT